MIDGEGWAALAGVAEPLWASLRVAGAATVVGLVLGSLLAWVVGRWKFPGRGVLEAALLLPLVLPPTVLGYYLLVLIGVQGPVGRAWEAVFGQPLVFTLTAAVVAASLATVPLVARTMRAGMAQTSRDVEEAARIDGAGSWALFWYVVLPQLRAPLLASGALAFARALGDFGATLMVAGNIPGRTQTASVAIYDHIQAGRDAQALYLVVIVSLVCLALLAATGGRRLDPP